MKIVLTNDDGIDAPGLAALNDAVRRLGWEDAAVVAPADALSGCSHRVTTDTPLIVEARGEGRFAVRGTPADCVRVALLRAAPDADWVLSGVNAGGNLGADVYVSGTVAAAREAVLHGKPAVAFSQYRKRAVPFDWVRTAVWAARVLDDLIQRPWSPGVLWNVNFPHLDADAPEPEMTFCQLDPEPLPVSYRDECGALHYNGDYHQRRRRPGRDVDVCFGGRIAVTRMELF